MNFFTEGFKGLSSLDAEEQKQEWVFRAFLAENFKRYVKVFVFLFCILLCFSFFIRLDYLVTAEYLLKRKSTSGFEAMAQIKNIESKLQESINIEPLFYSNLIREKAIIESAYQIQPKEISWLKEAYVNAIGFIQAICRKDPKEQFVFKNCHYDRFTPIFFSIRRLGEKQVEVYFNGAKKRFLNTQEISFPELSFSIAKLPKEQFVWLSYKVYPLQKALEKMGQSLKIKPEKNTKLTLLFRFFSKDKKIGERCLESLIFFAEQEVEKIKKNSLVSEIEVLSKKISTIGELDSEAVFQEKLKMNQLILSQLIEQQKKVFLEMQANEAELFHFQYLLSHQETIDEKICPQYANLFKKRANFSNQTSFQEQKTLYELPALDSFYLAKGKELEALEKEKQIYDWLIGQKEAFNLAIPIKNGVLLELFQKKQKLEEPKKDLSTTEKLEIRERIEKVQREIENEIVAILNGLNQQIVILKDEMRKLEEKILAKIDQELEFLSIEYQNKLAKKIEEITEKNRFLMEKQCNIQKQIDHEQALYQEQIQRLEETSRLSQIKKGLQETLFKRQIEQEVLQFHGMTLFSPKAENFPNLFLRIFLIGFVSFTCVLGVVLQTIFEASLNQFFPSKRLLIKYGYESIGMKDFSSKEGKKLLLVKRNILGLIFSKVPIKRIQDFDQNDLEIFDSIGIAQEQFSLPEIQKLLEKNPKIYFVRSSIL
jgi:hypothetical protein